MNHIDHGYLAVPDFTLSFICRAYFIVSSSRVSACLLSVKSLNALQSLFQRRYLCTRMIPNKKEYIYI